MPPQIMLINESAEIMELFHDVLAAEGYSVEVYPFYTGEIDEVEPVHPALVIMDCSLGTLDRGWSLLQRLRSRSSTASIPLIVASTSPQKLESLKQTTNGIAILPKPFDLIELLSVVEQSLTRQ